MTPTALRTALSDLFGEGSDRELAVKAAPVLRVHFRSIIKWLDGDRGIPGPVVALLECLARENGPPCRVDRIEPALGRAGEIDAAGRSILGLLRT